MATPLNRVQLDRFGRLYLASSEVSHAIVRSQSREELMRLAVEALVGAGEFAMAFIAWHDPATHQLNPVASCGDFWGYANQVKIFTDDRPEGLGPGGTAFRTKTPYFCNDFLNDTHTVVWRTQAHVSGWRASAAIPICLGSEPRALLSVYALEEDYFGPDESELLIEVSADIGVGLERLEAEERKREAEASLAASQRHLRLAMDAAGIETYDWDLTTGRITWGRRDSRLMGFEAGGFDGTWNGFASHIHPQDLPQMEQILAEAKASRKAASIDFRTVWSDGTIHWLSSRGEFSYNDAGSPVQFCGAVFDITQRRRAEEALRESQERLLQAVQVSNIGIFDHDHQTGSIYFSPECQAIFGGQIGPTTTWEQWFQLAAAEDRDELAARVAAAHDPGGDGIHRMEHRLVLPDGTIRWVSTRSQTTFEGEGTSRHPVRTVGAIHDITASGIAREELQKLASVVERSQDLIGIATPEGLVTYLNRSALTLLGLEKYPDGPLRPIVDFFSPSHVGLAVNEIVPAILSGKVWTGEMTLRRFDRPEEIELESVAFPVFDEKGGVLFVATIGRDLRERRRAERERERLEQQLFQANKMESIGRLAGGVAHDFNNMLTVILGYAALAKAKSGNTDPRLKFLEEIEKAGNRSREITSQLLGFSRRQPIAPRLLDLNVELAELRKGLERLIGEDITMTLHECPDIWKTLLDASQLNQIVMNLVVNARDAMPLGGDLVISTNNTTITEDFRHAVVSADPGEYVEISVRDSGVGMSPEVIQQIFEPFFTTKGPGKGTGLGLSTVYGFVKQNKGFLTVDSTPGEGATFRVFFPRAEGPQGTIAPIPEAHTIVGTGTVLLVEDDALVRELARTALQSLGFKTLPAPNAAVALQIFETHSAEIRLLLTDVVMPGMNGLELRDRILKIRPELPVLFMSGYAPDALYEKLTPAAGMTLLQKPFSIDELRRKIAEALSAR